MIIKIGNGSTKFYLVAEATNMGMLFIDLKITTNESWAKSNTIYKSFIVCYNNIIKFFLFKEVIL